MSGIKEFILIAQGFQEAYQPLLFSLPLSTLKSGRLFPDKGLSGFLVILGRETTYHMCGFKIEHITE